MTTLGLTQPSNSSYYDPWPHNYHYWNPYPVVISAPYPVVEFGLKDELEELRKEVKKLRKELSK